MIGPGALVDEYVVDSVIGSGAMGTVCVAREPDSSAVVALKILNRDVSGDTNYRSRFVAEVLSARSLHHPNIVRVYGHGETVDGLLWMAMQYVPGTDADRRLKTGQMSPQLAVHVVREVATALDYAHAHHVVHGDVKPNNFLLGQNGDVLLADFGLARSTEDRTPWGENGVVLASAAFASPEVLRGRAVDGRADVYSLGCALFRLLTGKPPFFDAGSKDAVVDCQLHREPPPVTRYATWLAPDIDDVVATAMAKDPAARYQSAGDLARAASSRLRFAPQHR